MRIIITLSFLIALASCNTPLKENLTPMKETSVTSPEKVLRHVVVFKYEDTASEADVNQVNAAFADLQNKIPEIRDFEWGLNNSPEGLDQEFTHVYTVTFHSDEDRAIYLPHPDHKAFVELIGPFIDKVFVVDYWTR